MKVLKIEFPVSLSVEDTWSSLTSKESMKLYFSPNLNIDFCVGGQFEILFNMDAPVGKRGSEGMKILSIDPNKMFSFTWNHPPQLSDIRGQNTVVNISLQPISATETNVVFIHSGFGDYGQWLESCKYFENAWGSIVLPRFKYLTENSCSDWNDIPHDLAHLEGTWS